MYPDQAQPYAPQQQQQSARVAHHIFKHQSGRLVIAAAVVAVLALAIAVAAVAMMLQGRAATAAQIRQLQGQVYAARQDTASSNYALSGLSGKVAAIDGAMAAITQFSTVCSQDLTGPNGPAQFDFMCRLHPAG